MMPSMLGVFLLPHSDVLGDEEEFVWSMVLNAADRSSSTIIVTLFRSNDWRTSFCTLSSAVYGEFTIGRLIFFVKIVYDQMLRLWLTIITWQTSIIFNCTSDNHCYVKIPFR